MSKMIVRIFGIDWKKYMGLLKKVNEMFLIKSKEQKKSFDKNNKKPVMRCSICTGEKVAGFKDMQTGKFEEVMLIKDDKDLAAFKDMYGIDTIEKEY